MTQGLQLGEVHKLETFDGKVLIFPTDDELRFLAYGSYGAPSTNFITRRGYRQDGVTEIDYTLDTRPLTIRLFRLHCEDRQEYWDQRAELLNFLRPNRNGPMTLTLIEPGGEQRSIIIRANPGLLMPISISDNSWNIEEDVEFIAFNPIWFDPATPAIQMTAAQTVDLVFPITFPIMFGPSGYALATGVINYTGTWKSYPVITITGPYTTAYFTNLQTNVSIGLTVAIGAGAQRIIDLTPGSQSITDASGNNRFSDLAPFSDLINFNLRPDPEVANGQQEILASLFGGTSDSAVLFDYENRYFGI